MCLNFHQANTKTLFHCIHNKVVQNPKKKKIQNNLLF
jgi:hypothetical protein